LKNDIPEETKVGDISNLINNISRTRMLEILEFTVNNISRTRMLEILGFMVDNISRKRMLGILEFVVRKSQVDGSKK